MRLDLEAKPMTILERRDDGSCRVRMPIAVKATIDQSKTSGGGSGVVEIGDAEFRQIVTNHGKYGRPIPAYFGHLPDSLRDGMPAAGFVESVFYEDGTLWAVVELGPDATRSIIDDRGYRGASVEMTRNPQTATGPLTGWVLTGFAITNNPALPVHYYVAASYTAAGNETVRLSVAVDPPRKGHRMSDTLSLEGLQADKIRLEAQVTTLQGVIDTQKEKAASDDAALTSLSKEVNSLRVEAAGKGAEAEAARARVKDMEKALDAAKAENVRLTGELAQITSKTSGERILSLARAAVSRGAAPALFDGLSDNTTAAEAVAWLSTRFVSVDAFQAFAEQVSGSNGTVVKFTARELETKEQDNTPSAQTVAALQACGINPKYANVARESDLRAGK